MSLEVAEPLVRLVGDELSEAVSLAEAHHLCDAVRRQHGDEVAAVLFYGSCLRKTTATGVLDFYVLVDSYTAIYGAGALAIGNALLPPNVFYLEAEYEPPPATTAGEATERPLPRRTTLRCKYAVISLDDFEKCVSPACLHSYIWARFAQPARLIYVRDAETNARVVRGVSEAVVTLVRQLGCFLKATGRVQRFSMSALWHEAFHRTYGAELRPESADSTRDLYASDSSRYEVAGMAALDTLVARGWLESVTPRGTAVEVAMQPRRRRALQMRWHLTRPIAKGLAVLRLLKTATTFGDWLPYALWKLERHSGATVELSERQRRHPLIFAWPVIFGLLRRRALR